jgi:hypothetical protein
MGTNPATSVTDTNGRFHHIANAYCADQSLFVECRIGKSNTNRTSPVSEGSGGCGRSSRAGATSVISQTNNATGTFALVKSLRLGRNSSLS